MTKMRGVVSVLVIVAMIILIVEIVLRCFYFQVIATKPTAIALYCDKLSNVVDLQDFMKHTLTLPPLDPDHHAKFLHDLAFEKDREEMFIKYKNTFNEFQKMTNNAGAALILLYVPGTVNDNVIFQDYFGSLAADREIPYLDASAGFNRYDKEKIFIAGHRNALSPYGHQMLAKYLYDNLVRYLSFKNITSFVERPKMLGDLRPSTKALWDELSENRYHVVTNSQGLRRDRDVAFPRSEQVTRILCMGGTLTFGPYVDNGKIFTDLMETSLNNVVVINAGMMDYTICDEYSYFKEKGQYLEPDIVLLQVTEDDLYGLYPHMQKKHCRGGAFCIK